MIVVGDPSNCLECSSKGDRRFSALYAKIKRRNNLTIETLYQARKLFRINGELVSGLSFKEAKGKKPLNIEDCKEFYRLLWSEYFQENPHLFLTIKQYTGFSDIFGRPGSVCQAEEIYRIRQTLE
jgi:hypothetical protein